MNSSLFHAVMRGFLLGAALFIAGCSDKETPAYQEQGYVFGTLVEISVYGEEEARAQQGIAAVMSEFQRLHELLHAWNPSELSKLNTAISEGKAASVSPELAAMLQDSANISVQSEGLFNPTIGGLIQLWGFQSDDVQSALPDEKKIVALVQANPKMSDLIFGKVNPSPSLPLSGEGVNAPPLTAGGPQQSSGEPTGVLLAGAREGREGFEVRGSNKFVKLDLGGYAKGYALDRAVVILKQHGINNALINIGGNILALGRHGERDWRVGIQHPRKPGALATLALRDGEAIGTSGDYQRYFELDGQRYSHLIDPRSGYPMQGVQAVTILTRGVNAGVLSDAASKPLFLSGVAGWRAAANAMKLAEALLVDEKGVVHLTPAMKKRLEFVGSEAVQRVES